MHEKGSGRNNQQLKVDTSKGYIYKYRTNNKNKAETIEEYQLADVQWNDEKGLLGTIIQGVEGIIGGILGIVTGLLGKTEKSLCGVNSEGVPDVSVTQKTLQNEYKNYRYTSDADYIIFRDIGLSSTGENSDKKDSD